MPSKIIILGSTGSIGVSALRVIRALKNDIKVIGLSCHNNLSMFKKQLLEFKPSFAAVSSEEAVQSAKYKKLKREFTDITFFEGPDGILELVRNKTDVLISAIVGSAGLMPALVSLESTKRLALANKETLVMAGDIVTSKVKENGVELIPVDSEHSAIFSLITKINKSDVGRIILTASGGSLREKTISQLQNITPEEALMHPTWDMGNKITIDSATMMNKGLEVIETHHLFNIDYSLIDVIIHPESIIHSMVETKDGAVFAYLSCADMAYPILNALVYPEVKENPFEKLDFAKLGRLQFSKYDKKRFPALDLCYSAGKSGGTMPAVLNAANEIAVDAFLKNKIRYTDIVKVVEKAMKKHKIISNPDITTIFESDKWAREIANSIIK